MTVYRIVHHTVTQLFSGSGYDSRWCSDGRKVIYTSSSVALACLENVLRRGGAGFSSDFNTVFYNIPRNTKIEQVQVTDLDVNWRLQSSYVYCQSIGNAWYDRASSFILKVPSAIIPDEYNFIIKTTSSQIGKITIIDEKPFIPDDRLELILTASNTGKGKRKTK